MGAEDMLSQLSQSLEEVKEDYQQQFFPSQETPSHSLLMMGESHFIEGEECMREFTYGRIRCDCGWPFDR